MKILLETEQLFIVEMTMDMAEDIQKNSMDEEVKKYVLDEVFETLEDAKATIEFIMSQYDSADGPLVYAVMSKDTNKNLGYVQLVPIEEGNWEIGYHIAKPYTCHGYATEAVKAFLPIIAAKLGIDKVYGICLLENVASGRVLEKCNFKTFFEGEGIYHNNTHKISKSVWSKS